MKHAMVAALVLGCLLAGCWRDMEASYLDPDYPNQRVTTIAILPILDKTDQGVTTGATGNAAMVLASLTKELTSERKYAVLPTGPTMARLRAAGGGAPYVHIMDAMGRGEEPDPQLFQQIARGLEADGLLELTIDELHSIPRDIIAPTSSGVAAYQQVHVTTVTLRARLWGTHVGRELWRDVAHEQYYPNPATEGDGSYRPAVELATHMLLERFPTNDWTPRTPPTPTPQPAPVTTYVPLFQTPSDPLNP